MLRKVFDHATRPMATAFALKRYGGIWGIKKHLQQVRPPNARLLYLYNKYFDSRGSWIGYTANFDGIPYFPHGYHGIFISAATSIGKNAIIFQQATIGSNTLHDACSFGSPTIGDSVYIGAGAKIIGDITIGDNCRIGANAVVYKDMDPHSVAVQSPTKIIQKSDLDNRFYFKREGKWVFYEDGNWVEDPSRDD